MSIINTGDRNTPAHEIQGSRTDQSGTGPARSTASSSTSQQGRQNCKNTSPLILASMHSAVSGWSCSVSTAMCAWWLPSASPTEAIAADCVPLTQLCHNENCKTACELLVHAVLCLKVEHVCHCCNLLGLHVSTGYVAHVLTRTKQVLVRNYAILGSDSNKVRVQTSRRGCAGKQEEVARCNSSAVDNTAEMTWQWSQQLPKKTATGSALPALQQPPLVPVT